MCHKCKLPFSKQLNCDKPIFDNAYLYFSHLMPLSSLLHFVLGSVMKPLASATSAKLQGPQPCSVELYTLQPKDECNPAV